MNEFRPSVHSSYGGISDAAAQAIGAGIQVAGTLAATGISVSAASKAQKSQQKHEKALAKAEADLVKLQAAASSAQASSTQAQSVVEAQSANTTLYIVGGVVLSVVVLSGAAVFIFRKPRRNAPEESDE